MNRKERMLARMPPRYYRDPLTNEIKQTEAIELDRIATQREDVFAQFDPATATWGIVNWEKILGIAIEEEKSLEDRRKLVLAKIGFSGTVTKEKIIQVAADWFGGEVEVVEEFQLYQAFIRFIGNDGVPQNSYDLKRILRELMPAHLGVRYAFAYAVQQILNIKHDIMTRIKLNVRSDPWALTNGDIGKVPFLSGLGQLDGSGFLTGRFGQEGPAHAVSLRYRLPIIHTFGVHTETIGPIIDGSGRLSGSRQIDGIVREVTVPVKHSTQMWKQMRETIVVAPVNREEVRVKSQSVTGARVLRGTGRLDGSRTLNNLFYQQPATLRVIKNGVVTEEIAI